MINSIDESVSLTSDSFFQTTHVKIINNNQKIMLIVQTNIHYTYDNYIDYTITPIFPIVIFFIRMRVYYILQTCSTYLLSAKYRFFAIGNDFTDFMKSEIVLPIS